MNADPNDLTIPAFLRAPPSTPEQRAALDRLVAVINGGGQREWIMPDRSKYQTMPAPTILIVNPEAPVEVWARGEKDVQQMHVFPNKAAFDAWYPKGLPNIGCTSTKELSSVMLDVAASSLDFSPEAMLRSATVGRAASKEPRVKTGNHDYIVNSHIGLVLKQKGFKRVSVEAGAPMTFKNGERTVVIVPPDPSKKSSSAWIVTDGTGKEQQGFGLSLKDKL